MTRLKRETDLLYGLNAGGEALYSLASTSILFFLVEMLLSVPDGTQSLASFHRPSDIY